MSAFPADALVGTADVPGDKSISHRALLLAGLAIGETAIHGFLEGEDVIRTAAAMRAMGCEAERGANGVWRIWGRGVGALAEPEDILDMGNSGTGARLLLGVLASHPLTAVMTGDASLRSRPMERVTRPLSDIGARFVCRDGRLPITVTGTGEALPPAYRMPIASAQVKSALLLAGLYARGDTEIVEPIPTRDHSERMLRYFGAEVSVQEAAEGNGASNRARRIVLTGQPELRAQEVVVPRDPSSAAFPITAAAILRGSRVTLPGLCLNPTRSGLIETLGEMGAVITVANERQEGGERVCDLTVEGSDLQAVEVPEERAPSMIDEYPILAVAASFAEGRTLMKGLAELRVKESDRLARMARGLEACGVTVEEGEDWLAVRGCGPGNRPQGGATVESALDHRIAMSFLVMGLGAEKAVTVDDVRPIDTSFPGFASLMRSLGADLRGTEAEGA